MPDRKDRDAAIDAAVENNDTVKGMMDDLQARGIVQRGELGELSIPQDEDDDA